MAKIDTIEMIISIKAKFKQSLNNLFFLAGPRLYAFAYTIRMNIINNEINSGTMFHFILSLLF